MSGLTVRSRCVSLDTIRTTTFCCNVHTSEQFSSSTKASPYMLGRLFSSSVRVDKFMNQRREAFARGDILKATATAPLHTGGGRWDLAKFVQRIRVCCVDRNDAASTGPLVSPNAQISLKEAVRLQMEALACNDEPRPDHGLEVMYYFANTEGTDSGGSLPQYFGFPSDLYHFGHFALKFKTRYPELINHSGYKVLRLEEVNDADKGDFAHVTVQVGSNDDSSTWIFTMSKHARGQQLPCWLTTTLSRCSSSKESSATHV